MVKHRNPSRQVERLEQRAGEIAQQVKHLLHKLDDLSLLPATCAKPEGQTGPMKLCFNFYMHAVARAPSSFPLPPHTHIHINTQTFKRKSSINSCVTVDLRVVNMYVCTFTENLELTHSTDA